ncbi:uncharacterized protein LOC133314221 [Gastrolobium bilobum]|uniref:uncharacterized protein LOC133314221 n=1 Tax=Gastrolobium bilobum TaxID=150636 RepID=UPI002AAF90D4|nr:uncharacterized protein LOC133314221 [Gastrolobium bilobum]
MYASPREEERHEMWNDVYQFSQNMSTPWVVAGDFNGIKDASEKKGGSQVDRAKCGRFFEFLDSCLVDELRCFGPKFTWQGPKWNHLDRVYKKLDRVCVNLAWRTAFQNSELMVGNWDRRSEIKSMMCRFVPKLQHWNNHVYGYIHQRKKFIMQQIEKVQFQRISSDCMRLQDTEKYLQKEFNQVLDEEEMLWYQKSRHNWIVDADKNARYYHLRIIVRRSSNKISRLKKDTNQWIEEPKELKDHVCNFYRNLFTEESTSRRWLSSPSFWAPVASESRERQWKFVNCQIVETVRKIWSNPSLVAEINSTLLRLKPLMENLVSPFQVSFVPNRQIQDNIIIVQELVHSMHKMKGKKAFMAIKIDLIKAYDKLSGKTSDFIPSRGIRQGDPLSPYLFVLAMEKLTHIFLTALNGGMWKPICLVLINLRSLTNASLFEEASGLSLSVEKTSIYFSKNADVEVIANITQRSGFKHVKNIGRYLGSMMRHGRASKNIYEGIVEKVKSKLNVWNQQTLSQAGHITLTNSVLAAMP